MKEVSDVNDRCCNASAATWKLDGFEARHVRNFLVRRHFHHVQYNTARDQQTQGKVQSPHLLSAFTFSNVFGVFRILETLREL